MPSLLFYCTFGAAQNIAEETHFTMLQQPERIRIQIFMQQRFHEKFHKLVYMYIYVETIYLDFLHCLVELDSFSSLKCLKVSRSRNKIVLRSKIHQSKINSRLVAGPMGQMNRQPIV